MTAPDDVTIFPRPDAAGGDRHDAEQPLAKSSTARAESGSDAVAAPEAVDATPDSDFDRPGETRAPIAPAMPSVSPLNDLERELDSLKHTVDAAKSPPSGATATLIAALENHHARLVEEARKLRHPQSPYSSQRPAKWDAAAMRVSAKARKGAYELGSGLTRAWREISASARKAWTEVRAPDTDKARIDLLEDKRAQDNRDRMG